MVTSTSAALTVAEAALRRRSVRRFTQEPVPGEDVEHIIRTAALAPSAFNLQPWRFVAVRDADLKARLAVAAYHQVQWPRRRS